LKYCVKNPLITGVGQILTINGQLVIVTAGPFLNKPACELVCSETTGTGTLSECSLNGSPETLQIEFGGTLASLGSTTCFWSVKHSAYITNKFGCGMTVEIAVVVVNGVCTVTLSKMARIPASGGEILAILVGVVITCNPLLVDVSGTVNHTPSCNGLGTATVTDA
jgi:hypothetical protein